MGGEATDQAKNENEGKVILATGTEFSSQNPKSCNVGLSGYTRNLLAKFWLEKKFPYKFQVIRKRNFVQNLGRYRVSTYPKPKSKIKILVPV